MVLRSSVYCDEMPRPDLRHCMAIMATGATYPDHAIGYLVVTMNSGRISQPTAG